MKSSVGILACVFGLFLVGAANATTLVESDVAGGDYSSNFRAPTVVAFGFDAVAGIGGVKNDDYFLFTGLPSRAQTLSLNFAAPQGYAYSYPAGGAVLYANAPFNYEWDGRRLATGIRVDHSSPRLAPELNLDDASSGSLYLALSFTHGAALTYSTSALSNAFPQLTNRVEAPRAVATSNQVPVSPALLLLGSSLLGLFYVGKARKGRDTKLSVSFARGKGLPMGPARGTPDPSLRARFLGVPDPSRLSRGRGVGRPAPSPLASRTAQSTRSPRVFSRGAPGLDKGATIIVLADVR